MTWSTVVSVARPSREVFLRGNESEESNGGCGEVPACLCHRSDNCEAACKIQFWWYHYVGWSVMLQRHCGEGSRVAVVFSVRCNLFLSVPYQYGGMPGGFDDYFRVEYR